MPKVLASSVKWPFSTLSAIEKRILEFIFVHLISPQFVKGAYKFQLFTYFSWMDINCITKIQWFISFLTAFIDSNPFKKYTLLILSLENV